MMVVVIEDFFRKEIHYMFREFCAYASFDADNDVDRDGRRPNTSVCIDKYWDGFEYFWDLAGEKLLEVGDEVWPEAMTERAIKAIELTRMTEGAYFAAHNDAPSHDPYAPVFTFLYYIGDADSFTGGEHFHQGGNNKVELYEPKDNCLMMYRGTDIHGVLPIMGKSAVRYTINGYFAP